MARLLIAVTSIALTAYWSYAIIEVVRILKTQRTGLIGVYRPTGRWTRNRGRFGGRTDPNKRSGTRLGLAVTRGSQDDRPSVAATRRSLGVLLIQRFARLLTNQDLSRGGSACFESDRWVTSWASRCGFAAQARTRAIAALSSTSIALVPIWLHVSPVRSVEGSRPTLQSRGLVARLAEIESVYAHQETQWRASNRYPFDIPFKRDAELECWGERT